MSGYDSALVRGLEGHYGACSRCRRSGGWLFVLHLDAGDLERPPEIGGPDPALAEHYGPDAVAWCGPCVRHDAADIDDVGFLAWLSRGAQLPREGIPMVPGRVLDPPP